MPDPELEGTWGVLGGAFDPVHYGHLALARELSGARDLSGVLFVPAYKHPFKGDHAHATYEHRVAMLKLALAGDNRLRLCEIEAEQQLTGYTVDTMRALKRRYPKASFRFIIGADLLDQVDRWHEPEDLLRETIILAGARPGYTLAFDPALPNDRVVLVPAATPDISSTELRAMIRRGEPRSVLRQWVPEAVLGYIEKERVYR